MVAYKTLALAFVTLISCTSASSSSSDNLPRRNVVSNMKRGLEAQHVSSHTIRRRTLINQKRSTASTASTVGVENYTLNIKFNATHDLGLTEESSSSSAVTEDLQARSLSSEDSTSNTPVKRENRVVRRSRQASDAQQRERMRGKRSPSPSAAAAANPWLANSSHAKRFVIANKRPRDASSSRFMSR